MSGIAGIFHRDGARVLPEVLQDFANFLAYCGPDGQRVWSDGSIGFVHTQFATTREARAEQQPASLHGRYWISADARLDARAELLAGLISAGQDPASSASDAELLLHAYAAWGEGCVAHLRGDFAFAVWDVREQKLFCARDHFGIKPFYYVEFAELFLFGNTLNCLRLHPRVSGELNEAAIGDFLLFGMNYDAATTTFRDIRRLPPAHTLTVSSAKLHTTRYWTLPVDGRIRYRRPQEYVEHYTALLDASVKDRVRTDAVSIMLSGGLDSGSIAATAKGLGSREEGCTDVRSTTYIYESLIPDDEGRYARMTAEFLKIPNRQMAMDYARPFERWDDPAVQVPEPVDDPMIARAFDQFRFLAQDGRVALNGEGNDNLMLFQMWPYAEDLWRRRDWARLFRETAHYLWIRPFPWRGIRQKARRVLGRDETVPSFPRWIAPDFAKRTDLEARWRERWESPFAAGRHPIHRKGYASMHLPQWTKMFEWQNPGFTRSPVEVRYPGLDLRMVEYLLALPPFPWFFQKGLVRRGMSRRLPDEVLKRRKSPLRKDPAEATLVRESNKAGPGISWSEESSRFLVASLVGGPGQNEVRTGQAGVTFRPHCLNVWLLSGRKLGYKL